MLRTFAEQPGEGVADGPVHFVGLKWIRRTLAAFAGVTDLLARSVALTDAEMMFEWSPEGGACPEIVSWATWEFELMMIDARAEPPPRTKNARIVVITLA